MRPRTISGTRSTGGLAVFVLLSSLGGPLGASVADADARERIRELESALFDPALSDAEVNRLLVDLAEPDERVSAGKALTERGQGHQDRISAFARRCTDPEARQACAEIVEALDASYRTTELGRELADLYRRYEASLLPAYWARFREDPLDGRAVAMLMAADPDETYARLGGGEDPRDRVRYLLLRVRELSPDAFAAKHFFEHAGGELMAVMRDVCPDGGLREARNYPGTRTRNCRTVGHVLSRVLTVSCKMDRKRQVTLANVTTHRRWTLIFRTGGQCAHFRESGYVYNASADSPKVEFRDRPIRRFYAGLITGICPLPEFQMGERQRKSVWHTWNRAPLPWWLEAHVPEAYRKQLGVQPRPKDAEPPKRLDRWAESDTTASDHVGPKPATTAHATTDPSAPAVVILPPRVATGADATEIAAAELVCDRLGQELTAGGAVRVLDRTQIDRVLREHALAAQRVEPMLSYDAMVRLSVATGGLADECELGVIEVSSGNVAGSAGWAWPVGESDVKEMVSHCRAAIQRCVRRDNGRLRVRVYGDLHRGVGVRLRPMADRLDKVLRAVLTASDRIELVHHFEAASNKEESLLLLMGMSRLPGGRQFIPQADATIEWQVKEYDRLGKTFEETPLAIGVRVKKGVEHQGEWLTTQGKVRDFDRLLAEAWRKASEAIAEADPAAAESVVNEMAARRAQAAAELQTARNLCGGNPRSSYGRFHDRFPERWTPRGYSLRRVKQSRWMRHWEKRMAHTASAVKLDPTYEEAAYEHVVSLAARFCAIAGGQASSGKVLGEFAEEIARYLRRFPGNWEHRKDVCRCLEFVLASEPFCHMHQDYDVDLSREVRQTLAFTKQALVSAVTADPAGLPRSADAILEVVLDGMIHTGVPRSRRRQWVDEMLSRCDEQAAAPGRKDKAAGPFYPHNRGFGLETHRCLYALAMERAMEEGAKERARDLMTRLLRRPNPKPWFPSKSRLRSLAALLDDPSLLNEFDAWADPMVKGGVMKIAAPKMDIFGDWGKDKRNRRRYQAPQIRALPVVLGDGVSGYDGSFVPLIEADDRLFVTVNVSKSLASTMRKPTPGLLEKAGEGLQIGYLPLAEDGGPRGELRTARPDPDHTYTYLVPERIAYLPRPRITGSFAPTACRVANERLYVGTSAAGLLVYDFASRRWTQIGPDQGLPSAGVSSLVPLSRDLVYVTGAGGHCKVDLAAGEVTLLYRQPFQKGSPFPRHLCYTWFVGNRLYGWGTDGLWSDLLGRTPVCLHQAADSLRVESVISPRVAEETRGVVEFGERRFGIDRTGLFEFNARGKTIAEWFGVPAGVSPGWEMSLPRLPTCPPPFSFSWIAKAGHLIVLACDSGYQRPVVAYDPLADTWFGPFTSTSELCRPPVSGRSGVWVGDHHRLRYLSVETIVAKARETNRAMTTAEFCAKRDRYIEQLSPLDRATCALAMRQFDRAKALCQASLDSDADDPQSLLLMGYLHDRCALDQPAEAIKYYRRLTELEGDTNALTTGLTLWIGVFWHQKRWREAYDLLEKAYREHPRLSAWKNGLIAGRRRYLTKRFEKKQPATSGPARR